MIDTVQVKRSKNKSATSGQSPFFAVGDKPLNLDGKLMFMMRSLTTLLLVLCALPSAFGQGVLTNSLSILKLTPEQAKENRPARIRGVVTMYLPGSQLCFVQDQSAGIYVQPAPWPKELMTGEVVEVTGQTAEGRFSPIIHMGVIKRTGEKRTLTPRKASLAELNTGRMDCQYIEVEGVLRKAVSENATVLELSAGGNTATALIFSSGNPPTNAIDALVRVRGVAGTLYAGNRLSGFAIFLHDASFLEVLKPASDPFLKPIRNSAKLAWYTPDGMVDHRIHVRGTVTFSWPGESFYIQDEAGALRVTPVDALKMPKPGDVVDAAGFVERPAGTGSILENALWRRVGSTNVPKHRLAHIADLVSGGSSGQLVSIEGMLISISPHDRGSMALVEEEGRTLSVFCGDRIPEENLWSLVRLTGVLSTRLDMKNSAEPGLWVNSQNDISVLKKPLITAESGGGSALRLACAAAVAASLVMVGLLWATRKKAAAANSVLQTNAEDLHSLQKEVAQLREGRERLGRDLHDHIIQSIYAVGLNLEDSRQTLSDPGKTESRIKTALAEINEVIRELRNVILGLETSAIQPQEFRTALKSLALTLGHANSTRIRLNIDQDALDTLSPAQATELVHIAREAMSNSIRHGQAETTTLSLQRHQDWVRFAVEDDGRGFDAEKTDTKGFGLRNMAKRAEALGAKFTITAQEGLGTRIVLDIPKQKQHFSNSEPRSIANR